MFTQKKRPVYLGEIRVARRSKSKRVFDLEFTGSENYSKAIIRKIRSAVDLPLEAEASGDHLAIDFDVVDYTRGSNLGVQGSELDLIGVLYRPKVELEARLRDGKSGKAKYRFKVAKRMPLSRYLLDSVDIRSMFRWSDRDEETFDRLLHECLLESLVKIRKYLPK